MKLEPLARGHDHYATAITGWCENNIVHGLVLSTLPPTLGRYKLRDRKSESLSSRTREYQFRRLLCVNCDPCCKSDVEKSSAVSIFRKRLRGAFAVFTRIIERYKDNFILSHFGLFINGAVTEGLLNIEPRSSNENRTSSGTSLSKLPHHVNVRTLKLDRFTLHQPLPMAGATVAKWSRSRTRSWHVMSSSQEPLKARRAEEADER
ncbi:hypothetical protein TNCV_530641 [Trichonephila clavipes]|nr:hypothetical protein TNCV_530641 [Trichonephila clavipes]